MSNNIPQIRLEFTDLDTGCNAIALIRVIDDMICLRFIIDEDNDLDIVISRVDCDRLIKALQREIDSFEFMFTDLDWKCEAIVVVRVIEDRIALFFSILSDGDLDIVVSRVDCDRLIDALQRGVDFGDISLCSPP